MPTMLFCRFGLGVCIIFAFFLKQSASVPAQRNSAEEKVGFEEIVQTNKKSSQKLFEGDIVPTWFEEEVENGKYNMRQKRDARRMLQYIWRTREVPYELTSDYDKAENDSIKNALKVFEAKTCLKFKVHTTERDWIQFRKMDGCFSAVGRQFWRAGAQIVSLGNGCLGEATILHEVMHALGFWHEQSRPDRDRYVEVLWENIDTDEMHNFNKYSHLEADVLGVNYDYQTMMHYGNKAFSKNGQPTMKAIGNPNLVLGTASTLSPSDITQINALYDCKSKYGSIWSSWSSYSPCDTYCQKTRQRFCFHSDLKQCSGANEHGIVTERLKCTPKECNVPIDGHWGRWTSWGKCDQSCGNGKKKRIRSCSDPSPKNGGKPCPGDSVSTADCFIKNCGLGKNDCEFDGQAWCFWKKYPDVFSYFMWSRKKGSTPSSMTGPSGDHTSGNGYYLYVEASSPAKRGDKARIISNEMKATDGVCFTFWYHMHGLTMGNLKVFLLDSKNVETEMLMLSGDKGNQWLNANKTIISKLPFKVIIEAENGPGYLSDIAIDDVKFKAGKCEKSSMEIKCGVEAKSLGCYAESGSNRVMPELLDSHRDAVRGHKNFMIDWNNYPKSVETLLCHCAQRAKAKGHKYFALQYYAECWSGPGEIDYKKYGSSKQCVDEKYQECTAFSNEEHCAGGNDANYVYQLV